MVHSKLWIVTGLMLLAAAGFAALGRWQLDRAEVNRGIESSFVQAANLPLIEQPVADATVDEMRYRRIRLGGQYQAEAQILLDNMTNQGVAGYQVLTPYRAAGSSRLLLVNRGWVPAAYDRSLLPDVALADDATIVTGRIDRLPRAALTLDAPPPSGKQAVTVMSFPDFQDIEAVLGRDLYQFQLLLDPEEPFGFVRDWAPRSDRDERNIAYAVQWFGLAALALVLATGMVVRGQRRPQQAPT